MPKERRARVRVMMRRKVKIDFTSRLNACIPPVILRRSGSPAKIIRIMRT